MTRPTLDQRMMSMATSVAAFATCPRKSVGAVLALDGILLASGYNGAPRGLPHCIDVGCDLENNSCQRVVHAETNAALNAARVGVSVLGSTCYVTASPCWQCMRVLIQLGVARIVYAEAFYRDVARIESAAVTSGIALERLS